MTETRMLHITCRPTRGMLLVVVVVVVVALLLLLAMMPHQLSYLGLHDPKPVGWTNLMFRSSGNSQDGTLTVAPIADLKSLKTDSLAGSAPLLTNVDKQKEAGKTLQRLLWWEHAQYRCQNATLIQNQKEGSRHYCRDKEFEIKPPCLVYSFGIAYDFTFDDFFGQMGCDVFSFDPSMDTPDHRRSRQVMFYQTGLAAEDNDSFVPRLDGYVKKKTTWKIRTLETLVSMLNHTHRTIDLLKMDVECSEWATVRNMLDSGVLRQVKQVLVEWHIFWNCPARERFQQLIVLLEDLKRAGFKTFDVMPHWTKPRQWDAFNVQSDVGYVNTRLTKH